MGSPATIRLEQIERAKELLQGLPEKNERKTRPEAAKLLERDFKKALKKGYDPKELSSILRSEGIIIPAYLISQFCAGSDIRSTEDISISSSEGAERLEQAETVTRIG